VTSSFARLDIDRAAIRRLAYSPDVGDLIAKVGINVRDTARQNARVITSKTDALISKPGMDTESVYTDVGYNKDHPGFFLWWHEVGTSKNAPTPHLRPALGEAALGGISPGPSSPLLSYTTRAGVTRQASQAKIDNWTRGSRSS